MPNQSIQIFDIGHYSEGKSDTGIPILEKIPIINILFSGSHKKTQFTKIIGILKLNRIENGQSKK